MNYKDSIMQRRCIACMKSKHKSELVRIAFNSNHLILDRANKVSGRGCYLCKNAECIKLALKNRGFNRSFKCNVDQTDVTAVIEQLLSEVDDLGKNM